ncbi:MAG: helix-turn-helix transcriptional regulator [Clostridiales bacterium]|nr:helix-turn-helix transcriptional regulator [Clostridiales bacterium]
MDFATNLRKYRKEKRMSQAELASFLGLSQRTISHYENGSAEPSLQSLYDICNTLQVSADVLLGINLEENRY